MLSSKNIEKMPAEGGNCYPVNKKKDEDEAKRIFPNDHKVKFKHL